MRTIIALAATVATLALTGIATAAPGGADVLNQSSCDVAWYGTVCVTVKATTNMTATPSGNFVYATNGTLERTLTFWFGGSFMTTSDIHLTAVQKKGELQVVSQASSQTTSYRSGTFALDCTGTLTSHYANGSTQYVDYAYDCTMP